VLSILRVLNTNENVFQMFVYATSATFVCLGSRAHTLKSPNHNEHNLIAHP